MQKTMRPDDQRDELERSPTVALDVIGENGGETTLKQLENVPTVALELSAHDSPGEELSPGTVVAAGEDGRYITATFATASAVIGVVAAQGAGAGNTVVVGESRDGLVAVTVLGIVKTRATDAGGPIRPGDMLTVGPVAGTAARTDHPDGRTILGKALDTLEGEEGTVHVLLMHG